MPKIGTSAAVVKALADKSYVCKELMQAGAGSEEGAAESPPLQKSFGSLVAKNIV